MKKPGPTKTAKALNRLQRAQRRAYQKNPTKKCGVHPVSSATDDPTDPTPKPRKRRGSYKLTDSRINALIRSINRNTDGPIELHCGVCGIHRDTYHQWRQIALAEPHGEHARQLARVDQALYAAWGRLHEAAVKHKASEVLFRRHHEHYPSERQQLELVGSGGLPLIPSEQQFCVVLELHQPGQAQEPEPGFRIVQPNGSVDLWIPPQSNGQEPPPL